MASIATDQRPVENHPSWIQRIRPAEGWDALALHASAMVAAAWAVQRAAWAPGLTILPLVAFSGLVVGICLAKTRVPDLLAHTLAFMLGGAFVAWQTTEVFTELGLTRRERFRALWDRSEAWYVGTIQGRQGDDVYLFVGMLGMMVWLVAYMSAWTLYRRGWLLASMLLPGFVILINLGYAPETGSMPLIIYLIAACTLGARHFAFRRHQEWVQYRIPTPERLPWRFLGAGGNVALLVVALAWLVPFSASSGWLDPVWDRLEQPWQSVERQWNNWMSSVNGPGRNAAGSYASFSESFQLGGPLNLSDDPALLLEADDAAYLIGYRYDRYDGHGWSTDVDRTFQNVAPDGRRFSPQLTFQPNQRVLLSESVTGSRVASGGTVTVLRPKSDLIFTTDTYVTSNRPTMVQLSWRSLDDEPFSVRAETAGSIPPDLRRLVGLLRLANFSGGTTQDGVPVASDPELAQQIADEHVQLTRRFLETRWDVGVDGAAETLYVTGQVPVYDDVEAVFDQTPVMEGDIYEITGFESLASPNELRSAGTEYPLHIRDRYFQLPTTITDRTRELAAEIAAGYDNPFDISMAVQNDLRDRITYREDIPFPPGDQDVVDYVLFDSQEGYCEYYASAMAVMLRSLNIPARVAVGYFPVPYDQEYQGYLYRERNAHAWVEVFFPGYGWIPFEPTSSRPTIEYGATATQPLPEPTPVIEQIPTPEPTPAPEAEPTEPVAVGQTDIDRPSIVDRVDGPVTLITVLVAIAVVFGILVASAAWLWGLRGLSPAGALYARLLRVGRWWGVRASESMTPTEYADALSQSVPSARGPAHRVATIYVNERYGGRDPGMGDFDGQTAWRQMRRVLFRSFWRRRRRR